MMNINKNKCPICSFKGNFKLYTARCQFSKELLERYLCSNCDVIFGPLRLLNISPLDLKKEYDDLIESGHKGFDSTGRELKLFNLLEPKKDGIYLNWGTGGFTSTINKINELGYNMYGYDPFISSKLKHDKNINDLLSIKNIKFDGIISNDVIEHIQRPIDEFLIMRKFLKPNGIMIHGTHCYKYCFEYSKFHLYFLQGKSIDFLCQNTGFTYYNKNKEIKIYKKISK